MPLPLIIAVAGVVTLLTLVGLLRLRAIRARRRLAPPVGEAEARAHAMPLTKSVLSVGPSLQDRGDADA